MLSSLINWFKTKVSGKARLIIEYLLLGFLVAVAGYSVNSTLQIRSLLKSNDLLLTKQGQMQGDLDKVVDVNKGQQEAIDRLKGLRETDASALSGLRIALENNGTKTANVAAKVSQLEKNNAEAKQVMDTSVPRDLGCVREGPECPTPSNRSDKNGIVSPAGTTSSAM
jgi:Tfp pilus assembly protein PilN